MTISIVHSCILLASLVGLALLMFGCQATSQAESETTRSGLVTMRGKPLTLEGEGVRVGQPAPDFVVIANDMSEKRLADYRGKTVILATVPSLDTSVCSTETRTFNERAAGLGDDVVVLTISMDLPMAQARWCGAHGIDNVQTLSDYRHWSFSRAFGLRMRENGLLARAVYVIDPEGVIRYEEIVPDLGAEPAYDAVLAAAR